ncbi:MAG: 1-(5-phosphoribosyl)-5-[Lachnospiraceae bacterium]|nr:1-(5-phosphoribosyl)-5-[(5-phosphoribosylamino)methylideneamino]imidazole-4-carboxamide isomerase [Lachnospiraceae bacterium]
MILLPAIDLIGGKAVRLLKGDYEKMTIYSDDPVKVAMDFSSCGAKWIHLVDLEGAKSGDTPNIGTIRRIVSSSGLKAEVGGGIRSMRTIDQYLESGVSRVILGTAAVQDPTFLKEALGEFKGAVAVGADLKDGFVAVKGWLEKTGVKGSDLLKEMEALGVKTAIVTDISRDGAMQGTNVKLYEELCKSLKMNVVASGGVSSLDDVVSLKKAGLYGAIVGKAYYTGAIDLKEAIRLCRGEET